MSSVKNGKEIRRGPPTDLLNQVMLEAGMSPREKDEEDSEFFYVHEWAESCDVPDSTMRKWIRKLYDLNKVVRKRVSRGWKYKITDPSLTLPKKT